MTQPSITDRVLILDFGSQVTQLIARRVRESGVYCEIWPYSSSSERITAFAPRAIILSGGPASVLDEGSPRAPEVVFSLGVPVLGICYGQQTMCEQLGGKVEAGHEREFGRAYIDITEPCGLFHGVWEKGGREQVWMSHGDRVTAIPEGFRAVAVSEGAPFAAIADDARRFYAVQFHPEVVHTPHGAQLLRNFTHDVAGCTDNWSMGGYRDAQIAKIRAQVGTSKVICGLSGGVDSSVAAVLIHEAIGDQLTCIFVDHGLLRAGEAEDVVSTFRDRFNIFLVHRDASALFLRELAALGGLPSRTELVAAYADGCGAPPGPAPAGGQRSHGLRLPIGSSFCASLFPQLLSLFTGRHPPGNDGPARLEGGGGGG